MNKKKIFVVLEGLSGAGKTTIGKILANRMEGLFCKTPSLLFSRFRDEIDRKANASARFLFYLAAIAQASEEILVTLKKSSVVCDRYLLTTLCYHRALMIDINIPDVIFASLAKPDFTFLVVCDKEKRVQRLYNRGLSFNDVQEQQGGLEERFLAEYRKYSLTEIDNSSDDPNMAVEEILDYLS